jgi:hypothetical protein
MDGKADDAERELIGESLFVAGGWQGKSARHRILGDLLHRELAAASTRHPSRLWHYCGDHQRRW